MTSLLEKIVNAYKIFLNNLNYGNTKQDYCFLYDAILAVKNNITDEEKYIQYFYNNMDPTITILLEESGEGIDTIWVPSIGPALVQAGTFLALTEGDNVIAFDREFADTNYSFRCDGFVSGTNEEVGVTPLRDTKTTSGITVWVNSPCTVEWTAIKY